MFLTERDDAARRIPELDGLRGVAIGLVLLVHYFVIPGQQFVAGTLGRLRAALTLSWSGVDLFFVLSGFLIGGILLDRRESPNYYETFYARRFYRIVPPYVLVCALYLLGVAGSVVERWPGLVWLYSGPVPAPVLATFTQNFWFTTQRDLSPFLAVTWSLAVEEHFYLTFPFIVRSLKPSRLVYVLAAVIAGAPLLRLWLSVGHPELFLAPYMWTPCRADSLAFGVAAALMMRNPAVRGWLAGRRRLLYLSFGLLLVGMVVLTRAGANPYTRSLKFSFLGYSWVGLFYLNLLLVALTHAGGRLTRALRLRPLTGLGVIAYGTYLLHVPTLYLCFGLVRKSPPRLVSPPDFWVALAALVLTLAAAKLSWEFFEKPLVRQGHKHRY